MTTPDRSIRNRVASRSHVALGLLLALCFWVGMGWGMDYYVATTAEDRFRLAMRVGDRAAACANAALAADAYQMALAQESTRRLRKLALAYCG